MAAILLGDKRLSDLKVTELKAELDKRGLSKKGVKSVLVERLKKAILREELSNVNDEEEAESGTETAADTSQLSQDGIELADSGSAPEETEVAAAEPVADAVDVGPDASSVDPDMSAVVEPPPVTSDNAAEDPVVDSTGEDEVQSAQVSDQTPLETEHDLPPSGEVDNITMDTESVAASDDGQEEEEKGQSNQPMDLGSPLDSDPEFDLLPVEQDDSMDMTGKEGGDEADETVEKEKEAVEEEAEEEGGGEKEEETEDKEEPGEKEKEEEKAKEGNEKRLDRLDSTFDSSYEPATEELLYEGDPDTDMKQETSEGPATAGEEEQPSSQDKEDDGEGDKMADTSATEKREEDEGFMVEVHYKDQGGSLEDPAATVIGPAPSSSSRAELREKGGKASLSSGGKTTGDSNRLPGCHLWVAGLVASVRALDLQTLFSPFGQVLSAKVVAKAQSKARFGYVTLATREQAQKCISELNGTELKGSTIHVELAKTAPPLSQPPPGEGKTPLSHRLSGAAPSRGKEGGAKNGHDSREKDKVGQTITRKSPGGGGGGTGEGKGVVKVGDRRDDRRRSSGSGRYHGDERPSHSRRSRSPPLRRSPRGGRARTGRTSPSPRSSGNFTGSSSLRGPAHVRDARDDIIRREEQRRDLMERRLGADPYYRDGSRQVMMEDRRFADRYQEMAARRQLELEQTRREQEMARRMQEIREREARDREMRERQLAEQERLFKERERVMREREYRERQRREQLEKELRERDQREKELRERERRLREQHIQELREREMKVAREREMREREVQAQVQRERELQEKEQRLIQEHQRIQKEKQLYEEQQRRLREEAERQAREREREAREREAREREAREREARERKMEAERERRLREEKERERERRERERVAEEKRLQMERAAKLEHEREQKRKQEELKWERESRMLQQQQRLGKRGSGYQDSAGYDMPKRQTVHDIRSGRGGARGATGGGGGGMDLFELSSSVFSRLDPQKQVAGDARVSGGGMPNVAGMLQGGGGGGGGKNSGMADSYTRRSGGDAGGVGGGGYRQGGGYGGVGGGMGRERHMDAGVTYPMQGLNKSGPNSSQGYQKSSGTIGGGVTVLQKSGGLSRQNQDIISAALANIQKSVSPSSVANQMRMPGSSPIQQISPSAHMSAASLGDYVSMNRGDPVGNQVPTIGGVTRQMMSGGGNMGPMVKPASKLPPEDERYNRRFARPSHPPRPGNPKRF